MPVTWGEPWAPQLTSHQMMRLGRERILYYFGGEHHSAMNMVTALCWYPGHWTRAAAHKIACHHTHSTTCSQNSSGTSVSLSWAKCFSSCTILSSRKTQQLQSQCLLPFPSMLQPPVLSSKEKSPGTSLPTWHISHLQYLSLVRSKFPLNMKFRIFMQSKRKHWNPRERVTESPVAGTCRF